MTENPGPTAVSSPHVHRIEVEISGGRPHGLLNGDITFKGVCDAEEGAPCRMWCDRPDCREEAQDGHESHPLVDQGECGVISSLNADPSFIPEVYDGPKTQLRSGCIELTQDIDGVAWHYCGEIHMTIESLADYHGDLANYHGDLVELHGSLVEQSNNLAEYHGSLREYKVGLDAYRDDLVKLSARLDEPPAGSTEQTDGPTTNAATVPSHPACADTCRHECGECRLGLGTHLTCDPRCDHHQLEPSQ
jgi:hypothetical protein